MKRRGCRIQELKLSQEMLSAAEKGNLDAIQALIQDSSNAFSRYDSWKLVDVAARNGHVPVVEYLLTMELDGQDGSTPLHVASKNGRFEVVELLVDNGADMDARSKCGNMPIHVAAESGHKRIVELFLTKGQNINATGCNSRTSLHSAAMHGHLELLQLLVEKNADVNAQCRNGYTPLHKAVISNSHNVLEHLIAVETINLNAQDQSDKTPLHHASESYDLDVVKRLLNAGARSDIKDNLGFTAAFNVVSNPGFFPFFDQNHRIVHDVLEKMHNYVDIDDKDKWTALHVVCQIFSSVNRIKLVLQHQKELNLKDVYGNTPLNFITWNYYCHGRSFERKVIRLFVDNKAYLKPIDCQRIIADSSLKKLFSDVKFCTKAIVNKFNEKDLPMIYRSPLATKLPILDRMKVKSNQVRMIEQAVGEEIKNKSYCDVSKLMPATLAMLSIKACISYCAVLT